MLKQLAKYAVLLVGYALSGTGILFEAAVIQVDWRAFVVVGGGLVAIGLGLIIVKASEYFD